MPAIEHVDRSASGFVYYLLCAKCMKALKCKTLGASVMYRHCIIAYTRQYHAYADKCVSVRGSIRKFGKDKSSE